jgi:4-hydroxy-tetrahydrodipicolinate reductase
MKTPVRVLLVGAAGRMGQAIERAAEGLDGIDIVGRCNRGDTIESALAGCDVAINFSHADATEQNCSACVSAAKPMVIGTTGHSSAQTESIERAAKRIPIVLAANFSVGVNTLFWLTRKAAELLGEGFDIEIVETHHRLKKDAPSGTAKRLAQILATARALDTEADIAHGRHGLIGPRRAKEIGMHAIRAGDVVGEHTVLFAASGERLELTHKASSRETFAVGALRAARWLRERSPGLYSMEDVLGLAERA